MAYTHRQLTPKQQRFVSAYLISLNATAAAIQAGYSARSADAIGCQLLSKPKVQAAIAVGTVTALERGELTRDDIVRAIARQVRRDVRALFDEDGRCKPITSLTAAEAEMIEGFEVIVKNVAGGDGHQDVIHKYRLAPRHEYVQLGARYFGLLQDRVHVTGDWDTLAARLASARQVMTVAVKVEPARNKDEDR